MLEFWGQDKFIIIKLFSSFSSNFIPVKFHLGANFKNWRMKFLGKNKIFMKNFHAEMLQGCEMILSIVANFAVIYILQNQLIKYKFKCQIKKKWRKFTIHRSITTFQFHLTMHFLHNCNATLMNNCHGQKQTPISVTKVTHEKHCRRNKILCSKSCGHKISINFVDCLLPPGDFQLAGITGYFLATKPTTWYRKWFHHEYTMRKKNERR